MSLEELDTILNYSVLYKIVDFVEISNCEMVFAMLGLTT